MFMRPFEIAPARVAGLRKAAEAAARAIPPAFPLPATVAVNPFLGQTHEDLATASERLGRLAGVRLTPPRSHYAGEIRSGRITRDDLAAALEASPAGGKPAGVADLLARLSAELYSPDGAERVDAGMVVPVATRADAEELGAAVAEWLLARATPAIRASLG